MKQGNSKSIKAVVKNLSDREDLDFQRIVTRYLHERLLYRISLSEYSTTFILKGGNLMYAIEGLHTRPTIDIDMLAKNIDNDKETIKQVFAKICAITDTSVAERSRSVENRSRNVVVQDKLFEIAEHYTLYSVPQIETYRMRRTRNSV